MVVSDSASFIQSMKMQCRHECLIWFPKQCMQECYAMRAMAGTCDPPGCRSCYKGSLSTAAHDESKVCTRSVEYGKWIYRQANSQDLSLDTAECEKLCPPSCTTHVYTVEQVFNEAYGSRYIMVLLLFFDVPCNG
jgi:hypothetical protein